MVNERPLTGKKILVTRPKELSNSLLSKIKEEGGIPLFFPIVAIEGSDQSESLLTLDLSRFQWLVFTSKNGVDFFFKFIQRAGLTLSEPKIAAVGEKTRDALYDWGITDILVPSKFEAAALVELLKKYIKKGDNVLFPKGNLAPSYIMDELKDLAYVEEVIVYETKPNKGLDWDLVEKADCYFFLSPSAVHFMMNHTYITIDQIESIPVFCIGPSTMNAAIEHGFKNVFMPDRYTAEDLIERAVTYFQGGI
jgi:uroporphyrinogen-III synthase